MKVQTALRMLREAEKELKGAVEAPAVAKLSQAVNALLKARGARMLVYPIDGTLRRFTDFTFKVDLEVREGR